MKRTKEPKRARVLVTPSAALWELLERIQKITGQPKASLISEMLDTVEPVYRAQLEAHLALEAAPENARELVSETGWRAVQSIAQAQLDLPPPKKTRRPRRGAT